QCRQNEAHDHPNCSPLLRVPIRRAGFHAHRASSAGTTNTSSWLLELAAAALSSKIPLCVLTEGREPVYSQVPAATSRSTAMAESREANAGTAAQARLRRPSSASLASIAAITRLAKNGFGSARRESKSRKSVRTSGAPASSLNCSLRRARQFHIKQPPCSSVFGPINAPSPFSNAKEYAVLPEKAELLRCSC